MRTNKRLSIAGGSLNGQVQMGQVNRKRTVLSSFLSGPESSGISLLITLLLVAGLAGVLTAPRHRVILFRGSAMSGQVAVHSDSAQYAENLALTYYAKKYGDRDVSVEVRPGRNHSEEALIRRNGFLVKKLSIRGNSIVEEHTGLHDWIFDLLTNVN